MKMCLICIAKPSSLEINWRKEKSSGCERCGQGVGLANLGKGSGVSLPQCHRKPAFAPPSPSQLLPPRPPAGSMAWRCWVNQLCVCSDCQLLMLGIWRWARLLIPRTLRLSLLLLYSLGRKENRYLVRWLISGLDNRLCLSRINESVEVSMGGFQSL